MTKRNLPSTKPRSAADASGRGSRQPEASADGLRRYLPSPAAIRETIESVAIALVLAFLFRTFEAEAFVIPTGSMAPTLMGRHKDLVCPKCGCPYQVGDSEEVDRNGVATPNQHETQFGTCPMCRYTARMGPDNPSYNGDRILVGKFVYEFANPQRWDVMVFKYPNDAPTNFIKRLVGLPGETVRIQHGDIWIRDAKDGDADFHIARKPPEKLLAMLQPVFDNDYMPRIAKYGWPARWSPDASSSAGQGTWTSDDYTTFSTEGTATGENWLRYHHLVPSYRQWESLEQQKPPAAGELRPQLITDFTAYDTNQAFQQDPSADAGSLGRIGNKLGINWVGDLAVALTANVESPDGQLILELRKGGRRFQCRFDLATGRAVLSIGGPPVEQFHPAAQTGVRGPGRHDIRFSNCDDEMLLWVDGRVVSFDAPTRYDDLGNDRPDASDLTPVGVASAGARVQISHLRVFRDIFYGADRALDGGVESHDVAYEAGNALPNRPIASPSREPNVDFSLRADQFFVLGDNSECSKDGRLWGPEYWVSRDLLIGKALFIYWPHSWDKIPYVNVPFPYFPNFARMGLVR